jgi:hypothetical protein
MSSKKTRLRPNVRKQLPISEPLLPRAVSEQMRTNYPNSIIFTPSFSDLRHEMLTNKMACTSLQDPRDPKDVFDRLFPAVLKGASSTNDRIMGGSWLHVAVRQGDLPLAHECVRLGTPIRHNDRRGYSALYLGCIILKDILSPEEAVPTSFSPEFTLLLSQLKHICLFLLDHHADANEIHDGLSLLALACIGDQWDLIRALLLHGAHSSSAQPARFLKTPDDKNTFDSLVSKFAKEPRPRRPCPCGSSRPLVNCHAQAQLPSYPVDSICPCGSGKTNGMCCVKRTDMCWVERWDPHAECLERVCLPRNCMSMAQRMTGDISLDPGQDLLRMQMDEVHSILKGLARAGRIDPAFAAAGCRVHFQPMWYV